MDRQAIHFSAVDLERLRQARSVLETPGLAIRLANLVGQSFEGALARLPGRSRQVIARATDAAVRQCLRAAITTLDKGTEGSSRPRKDLHKFAVGLTGAVGGAFGFTALAIELPVTTTLMFRSICAIARSQGEDLEHPDARLQCLTVLALGGPSRADDEAETGYFALRAALAEIVSQSAAQLAGKRGGAGLSSGLLRLASRVAERYSIQVSQQLAAKSVPVLGAVLGATVNTIFMDHFQAMAEAHFSVRALERQYGPQAVEAAYRAF